MKRHQPKDWSPAKNWIMGIAGALLVSAIVATVTWVLKPDRLPCVAAFPESLQHLTGAEYAALIQTLPGVAFPIDGRLPGTMDKLLAIQKLQDRGLMKIVTGESPEKPPGLENYAYAAWPTEMGNLVISSLQSCLIKSTCLEGC